MQSFLKDVLGNLIGIGVGLIYLLVVIAAVLLLEALGGESNMRKKVVKVLNRFTQGRFASETKPSKKRLAVRSYIKYVGPELRKRHGAKQAYTPAEVRQVVNDSGYSSNYDCYALAMYCSHNDFVNYHRSIGESCDYNSMRHEISNSFNAIFQGNTTFEACDVIDLSDRVGSTQEMHDSSASSSDTLDVGSGNESSSSSSNTSYESNSSGSDYSSGSDFSSGGDFSSGSDYSSGSD